MVALVLFILLAVTVVAVIFSIVYWIKEKKDLGKQGL